MKKHDSLNGTTCLRAVFFSISLLSTILAITLACTPLAMAQTHLHPTTGQRMACMATTCFGTYGALLGNYSKSVSGSASVYVLTPLSGTPVATITDENPKPTPNVGTGGCPTPTLGTYPTTTVVAGQSTTVAPNAAPTNTTSAAAYANTNFTGVLTVNPATGVVTVTAALQAGVYTVTVQAFNGACASATATFSLTVTDPACSQGNFGGTANLPMGSNVSDIAIGDFNGDGKQDFAACNSAFSGTVFIRLGDGMGGFTAAPDVAVGGRLLSIALGDFNGDGKQDFVVANYLGSPTVSVRLGDGTGGFSAVPDVGVGASPISVAIGDFNGDGKQDLAVANADIYSNSVSIRLGDGMGGFSGTTDIGVGSRPSSVAVGDFNGDGKQDFATANTLSSSVSIRLGDGMGGFSALSDVVVGSAPNFVSIGDFNADGKQDLAVANEVSRTVSIRLGNGMGGFSNAPDLTVGNTPVFVAVGDFNGDGKQDLAVANQRSGTVSIRLGNGMGGFSALPDIADPNSKVVAIGDFNGDGRQDLATSLGNAVTIRLSIVNEINLRGNGMDIADGDNTPSGADHTDFGATTGAPITRSFTIQNVGTEALNLASDAITITGPDASLFSFGYITLPTAINGPSGSITFEVTYTPVGLGLHTATVNIANDDCNEAMYDFAIRGQKVCPTFTAAPANVTIINSTCTSCAPSGGRIAAPGGTPCPAGSTLQYQVNDGTWGSTLPTYAQTGPAQTIKTRCSCDGDPMMVSAESNDVTTIPGICTPPTASISVFETSGTPNDGIVCPGVSATMAAGVGTSYSWSTPSGPSTDNPLTVTVGGAYTVTVTGTNGCTATASATIIAQDITAPGIACPANIIRANDANQCGAAVTYAQPVATDNCGGGGLDHLGGGLSGSTFPVGNTTVTWMATDGAGLTATCSFTVTVTDAQAPNIACPANQAVGTDAGQCYATVSFATPTGSDNCALPPNAVARTSGPASGSAFPKGTSTVVFKVTDAAGLTKTCSFRVIVSDAQNPTIVCPGAVSVPAVAGQCSATIAYTTPTATDNCAPTPTVVRIGGTASGSTVAVGNSVAIWRAIDGAGRSSTCSIGITVTDNQAPTIVCPQNIAQANPANACNTPVFYSAPTAADNCGVNAVFMVEGMASGSSFPVGVTSVVWRAVDNNGLSATCSFSVTVSCGTYRPFGDVAQRSPDLHTSAPNGARRYVLSPNPAAEMVDIVWDGAVPDHVVVFDAQGRLVWEQAMDTEAGALRLDVSDWTAGVYLVSLRSGGTVVVKRLVVCKDL